MINFTNAQQLSTGKKILIAYYSRSGNTQKVAAEISKSTGGNLFKIETATPYPEDFDLMVKKASEEKKSGFKPFLKTKVDDMDSYDIIFIGFPIWDMSLPAPIKSFLSAYDFSGKMIIPFCTHDGYGKGSSFDSVKEYCSKSEVSEGFAIKGSTVDSGKEEIRKWLKKIKIIL
jgi:flavodoxin